MRWINPLLVSSLVAVTACTANVTGDPTDDAASSSSDSSEITIELDNSTGSMMDSSSSASGTVMPSSADADSSAASAATTGDARVIEMTATDWSFSPSAITARKGEKVVVRLRGDKGVHGFGIKDLNLNVRVEPGQVVDIELPTGTEGAFTFRCFVPCGPGHKDMTGTLTVSA